MCEVHIFLVCHLLLVLHYIYWSTLLLDNSVVLLGKLECDKSGRSRQDGTVNRNRTVSADWWTRRACLEQVCELSGSRTCLDRNTRVFQQLGISLSEVKTCEIFHVLMSTRFVGCLPTGLRVELRLELSCVQTQSVKREKEE